MRRKQRTTVDSDDDDVDEIAKRLTKAKTAPRTAKPPAAQPSVAKLSLEDDEGEEIFKKKKKKPKARGVSTSALNDTAEERNGKGASYSEAACRISSHRLRRCLQASPRRAVKGRGKQKVRFMRHNVTVYPSKVCSSKTLASQNSPYSHASIAELFQVQQ